MASKRKCKMCRKENAVGHCKSCGYVGETFVDTHKIEKMFKTHTGIMLEAVKKHDDSSEIPNVKFLDITEEMCKQHPTEKAIFLCNIHDSMFCGRCLHLDHIPCAKEVVDLMHEAVNIDCEKVNTMKSRLVAVKEEFLFMKDEAKRSKENCNDNADKFVQECLELGNKIKQRVDRLTNDIKEGITVKHNANLTTHSHITELCGEKIKWCDNEESKIDDFVDNNKAGHLYLMSRHFEEEVSKARSHLKEIKHKHTFKEFEFKENKVILKCVFEDLEEVCELQDEVVWSDDGTARGFGAATTKINKTRRELTAQLKRDLDQSEKTRRELTAQLKQVKRDLDQSKKETSEFRTQCSQIKDNIKWTQPTGTVDVKTCTYKYGLEKIILNFTFPDGTQTTHHSSPGKKIKGDMTFDGVFSRDCEGEMLSRMLKAAFRRGIMFNLGKTGTVILNGVTLYTGSVYDSENGKLRPTYVKYIKTLKKELRAKGITEANIDQTGTLEEAFTVDGC